MQDKIKEIYDVLDKIAELKPDDDKFRKRTALVKNIISFSSLLVERQKLLYTRKAIFKGIDRNPKKFKKIDKTLKLITNHINLRMTLSQHLMITSQPIRK